MKQMIAVAGNGTNGLAGQSVESTISALSPVISRRRAVIFDCDDTLLITAKSRWPVLISTALVFGYRISNNDICNVWGEPYRQMIEQLLPGINVDDFTATYKQASLKSLPRVAPGAESLLALLAENRIVMHVLTANHASLVEQDFKALGIRRFFEHIYGCDDTEFHKPDGRALSNSLSILADLGMNKSDSLYIGDGWRDFYTARDAGIDFVAVCTGLDRQEVFQKEGLPNDQIISSLNELLIGDAGSL